MAGWAATLAASLVAMMMPLGCDRSAPVASVASGYEFLRAMMDRQATGAVLRLPQSYTGGTLEESGYTSSATYDDALMIDAFLARGTDDDVTRAGIIADALLYVQDNDPAHDGRIRASYAPNPLTTPDTVVPDDLTSDVGAMAWAGQALLQMHAKTKRDSYLAGARSLADWIQRVAGDDRGSGGYTGGLSADGARLTWKSTEHNLDLVGFFGLLANATGDATWADRAQRARVFVLSMYDEARSLFWTGTGLDGATVNKTFIPADAQTWSYLVLRDPRYAGALDYAATAMAATDGPFHGISATADERGAVWFEGTAQLAQALLLRGTEPGATTAANYLASVRLAQTTAPNNDGKGIVASSRDTPPNAQGSRIYASLHTGTTSWYVLAEQGKNPFYLLPES